MQYHAKEFDTQPHPLSQNPTSPRPMKKKKRQLITPLFLYVTQNTLYEPARREKRTWHNLKNIVFASNWIVDCLLKINVICNNMVNKILFIITFSQQSRDEIVICPPMYLNNIMWCIYVLNFQTKKRNFFTKIEVLNSILQISILNNIYE